MFVLGVGWKHPTARKCSLSNKTTYKILGVVGQEIQSGIINNIEKQINVSLLSEGIYLLQLYENNEALGQQKFVKITK